MPGGDAEGRVARLAGVIPRSIPAGGVPFSGREKLFDRPEAKF